MTMATAAGTDVTTGAETQPEKHITTEYTAAAILRHLTAYMSSGENRKRFVLATIVRIVAVCGLVTLPIIIGEGINVLNDPAGTMVELQRWIVSGIVAALVFVVASFFAARMFADLATKALVRLQTHRFTGIQTLSMGFYYSLYMSQFKGKAPGGSDTARAEFVST